MPEILNNINWIDLVFIILLLGMVYKGLRTGVGGQLLSLAGWLALLFFTITYYSVLSEAIFGSMLQKWAKPVSFFAIAAAIFIGIKLLERMFSVMHGEEMAAIERIGGAIVACMRAFIFFGMIGMLLLLVPVDKVNDAIADGSRSGMHFVEMDARIYSMMTDLTGFPAKKTWAEVVKDFDQTGEKDE